MDFGDPQKGDDRNEKTYSDRDRGPARGGSRRGRSRPLERLVGGELGGGPSARRYVDGDGDTRQSSARPRPDVQVATDLYAWRRDDRDEQYRHDAPRRRARTVGTDRQRPVRNEHVVVPVRSCNRYLPRHPGDRPDDAALRGRRDR